MYAILWEFQPRTGTEQEFERAYGPNGVWPEFFKKGDGYLGTELLKDVNRPGTYVTIDRWRSQDDYDRFCDRNRDEYAEIDKRCEELTDSEVRIGSFTSLGGPGAGGPQSQAS